MKTTRTLAITTLLSLELVSVLSSCGPNTIDYIYFSELFNGSNISDCAVELATNKDTSLDGFKINFYRSNKIEFTQDLKGFHLKKDEPLVILNKDYNHKDDFNNKIRLETNPIYNCFYFELIDDNNNVVDSIGLKSYNNTIVENESLIRLKEFSKARPIYQELDFIRARSSSIKYLGNTDAPLTLSELLEGPKFDEDLYGHSGFLDENGKTSGGYCEVTVHSLGDGDTTRFNWPSDSGIPNTETARVRYLLIDTPEIPHPEYGIDAEPFGEEAKNYNNDKLRNAKKIIVQSNKGFPMKEGNDRTLGYVWYSNKENPTFDDYRLLNFEMVRAGLARVSYRNRFETMISNDVLYSDYFNYVYKVAESEGIKIHGETDPDFEK